MKPHIHRCAGEWRVDTDRTTADFGSSFQAAALFARASEMKDPIGAVIHPMPPPERRGITPGSLALLREMNASPGLIRYAEAILEGRDPRPWWRRLLDHE